MNTCPSLPSSPLQRGQLLSLPWFQGRENNLAFSEFRFFPADYAPPSLLGTTSHLTGHLSIQLYSDFQHSCILFSGLMPALQLSWPLHPCEVRGTLQIPWVHHHFEKLHMTKFCPTYESQWWTWFGYRHQNGPCHLKFPQPYLDHNLTDFFLLVKVFLPPPSLESPTSSISSLDLLGLPFPECSWIPLFFPGCFLAAFPSWLIPNSAFFASAPRLLSSAGTWQALCVPESSTNHSIKNTCVSLPHCVFFNVGILAPQNSYKNLKLSTRLALV